jgi:PncC family amidohydrolase
MADFREILLQKESVNPEVSPTRVADLLTEKKATLAVAESITGGAVCAELVKIPGASKYLLGGVVAYSNRIKVAEVRVNPRTIARYGAVSSQVCLEMAQGIRHKYQASIGVATTGFAGPRQDNEKVGLTYIGCVKDNTEVVKPFLFSGERESIIRQATFAALDLLRYTLSTN